MNTREGQLADDIARVVVFDTNAYRDFGAGGTPDQIKERTRILAEAERSVKIQALANPFVIWELIAHLAAPSDPNFNICLKALVALVEHTRLPNDNTGGVCRIPDGETDLCRQLFNGRLPPHAEENAGNLCKLASHVWKNAPLVADPTFDANCQAFGKALDDRENAWISHMESLLKQLRADEVSISQEAPTKMKTDRKQVTSISSSDFVRACALGKVANIATLLGLMLSPTEANDAANRLQSIFPTALQLMQRTVSNWLTSPEMNLRNPKKNRANFVWDTALCFCIGKKHGINNASITFITNDKQILGAANDAGCPELAMKLDDYKASILSKNS